MKQEEYRIGKYEQAKNTPMKIKLKSQTTAEETSLNVWKLAKSNWKLGKVNEFKLICFRKETNEEERKKNLAN